MLGIELQLSSLLSTELGVLTTTPNTRVTRRWNISTNVWFSSLNLNPPVPTKVQFKVHVQGRTKLMVQFLGIASDYKNWFEPE